MKPLCILNTRPIEQGQSLNDAIFDAGGIALSMPMIAIEPTSLDWLINLPELNEITHAIFVSTNAVNYFFKAMPLKWPKTIQTIAIGQATKHALEKKSIVVHSMPPIATSEQLIALEVFTQVENQPVLLIKGEGGRQLIEASLIKKNANLITLAVYRRVLPTITQQHAISLWRNNAVDIILITSEQTFHNLFTVFGKDAREWLCNKTFLVISPRLAAIGRNLGIKELIISQYDKIITTLKGIINDQHY